MRAVVYTESGDTSVLELVEREVPDPGPGEVRVRIVRAGVNPTDWKFRAGGMGKLAFPEIVPGQDGAGVVDAVGPGVTDLAVGDRVWTMLAQHTRPGGTAQERVDAAGERAAAELAASICVHRFLAAPDAGAKLAELKKESRWSRDDLVQDAGWTTFAAAEEPVDGAAELCAEKLAEAELPATAAAPAEEAADAASSSSDG